MPDTQSPLVAILGPTAVGKTEMAIQIAEKLNGEIVSADSRLFYRGMDIGTAKPTLRDRSRVPHHLIDISNPDQIWSLAIFQQVAHQAINDIQKRHRLPLLVGGTGQYIRAVIEGWKVPAVEPAPALRKALQKWEEEIGPQELHLRLEILDPVAARNIDPRNVRRVIRALEVILCTGQLFSTQRIRQLSPYHTILLGLTRPRSELYTRIDERVNGMFAAGLVNEVYNLLQQGYSPDLPTLSAIGYKQPLCWPCVGQGTGSVDPRGSSVHD